MNPFPTPAFRRRTVRCLLLVLCCAAFSKCARSAESAPLRPAAAKSTLGFLSPGTEVVGQSVWLAIDDQSLPLKHNLCYYLSKPAVRPEAVLTPSRDNPKAPDFMAAHFYGSVLFDQNRFRMWYYAVHHGRDYSDLKQGPVCYAESVDGIKWVKPSLRQVEFNGSLDNNVVRLPDEGTQAAEVIVDRRDADPQRRYKMVYNTHNGPTAVFRTATSPDGTRWRFSEHFAVNNFIELSSFYRHQGLFVVNGQGSECGEGGGSRGRQGYAWVSPDFEHWLPEVADAFLLPEPAKANDRGTTKPYDQVHLGVGGASFGNVVVGLYGRWHNFPGDTTRAIPNSWFGFGQISCDLGLLISNDGLHFREPVKDHIYLAQTDSPVSIPATKPYPGILCQSGNGILNVGDETRIYHGRWRNAEYGLDYWGEVALATLPRDRWGALGLPPDEKNGWVWSAAVRLPSRGWELRLNADAADAIQVEAGSDRFELLPGFSGAQAGHAKQPSGLDCPVVWPASNARKLAGKTVRFRFHLNGQTEARPRLYAVYIQAH